MAMKFHEAPPDPDRSTSLTRLADKLKKRPGQWAFIGTHYGPTPGSTQYKKRGMEVVTRSHEGKQAVDVYVRWPNGS